MVCMSKNKDNQILTLLVNNPGISQKEIAKNLGVSPPAINNRIQRMRKKGIIKGFVPLIDLGKLGFELTAIVKIRVKGAKFREAAEFLVKEKHVCSVYMITGEHDVLAVAKFKHMSEMDQWTQDILKKTDVIERTSTSVVFDPFKESTVPNEIY